MTQQVKIALIKTQIGKCGPENSILYGEMARSPRDQGASTVAVARVSTPLTGAELGMEFQMSLTLTAIFLNATESECHLRQKNTYHNTHIRRHFGIPAFPG